MEDKISIIIPIYNVEKYLSKCLDSVCNQSYKNIEIVCVNDGSTDKSLEILKKYSKEDNRFKIISRENKGLLYSRIEGTKKSTGKYVTFLDSDDWIDNDYIEKLYYYIKEYNCDIVRCNLKFVSDDEKIIKYQKSFKNNYFDSKKIKDYVFLEFCKSYKYNNAVKQLMNRKILKDINKVDTTISMGEDLEFNMNIYDKVNSLFTTEYCGYNYRYNPNSISKVLSKDKLKNNIIDEIKVYDNLINFIEKQNKNLIQYAYCRALNQICEHLMRLSLADISFDEFSKISQKVSCCNEMFRIRTNIKNKSLGLIKSKKSLFIKIFFNENLKLFNYLTYFVYKRLKKGFK